MRSPWPWMATLCTTPSMGSRPRSPPCSRRILCRMPSLKHPAIGIGCLQLRPASTARTATSSWARNEEAAATGCAEKIFPMDHSLVVCCSLCPIVHTLGAPLPIVPTLGAPLEAVTRGGCRRLARGSPGRASAASAPRVGIAALLHAGLHRVQLLPHAQSVAFHDVVHGPSAGVCHPQLLDDVIERHLVVEGPVEHALHPVQHHLSVGTCNADTAQTSFKTPG
mmetsp:Transcript_43060/g.119813  ORF Transcript_43060/g.119813 Transcript_43060/m.119813 type:complete len:223 (+) Transcript_43060:128-796(+)